ncbi:helix-turn-helix domain-containing protein [Caminicella sporogenes]|uniref:helix-turn-helix domain-containing protein n=1 Tax=Caminicella sporogenes TaxID=166485 RepID=UPI00254016B6|nr:DNA-binding protein [Caminicella sporogenes]WIF94471.1 DNA-binding protein [Caminicella sporogenes]
MSNNICYEIFPEYPEVLNARMIAEILDLGYAKALKLIKYGGMNYIRIGNVYRIPKRNFIEWLYSGKSKIINLDD